MFLTTESSINWQVRSFSATDVVRRSEIDAWVSNSKPPSISTDPWHFRQGTFQTWPLKWNTESFFCPHAHGVMENMFIVNFVNGWFCILCVLMRKFCSLYFDEPLVLHIKPRQSCLRTWGKGSYVHRWMYENQSILLTRAQIHCFARWWCAGWSLPLDWMGCEGHSCSLHRTTLFMQIVYVRGYVSTNRTGESFCCDNCSFYS